MQKIQISLSCSSGHAVHLKFRSEYSRWYFHDVTLKNFFVVCLAEPVRFLPAASNANTDAAVIERWLAASRSISPA
jgi:hypothetical protein